MQTRSNDDYTQLEFNKDGVTFKNIHVDWKDDDFLKTHPNPPRIVKLIFYLNQAQNDWDYRIKSNYQPQDLVDAQKSLLMTEQLESDEKLDFIGRHLGVVIQQMEVSKIITLVNRGVRELEKRSRAGRLTRLILLNPELAHFLSVLRAVDFEKTFYLIEQYFLETVPNFRPKTTPVVYDDHTGLKWLEDCLTKQPKLKFNRETGKLMPINN